MSEWEAKHRGHDFEFLSLKREIPKGFDDRAYEAIGNAPWWLDYKHNADIKIAYGASAAITITLASLAASSTLLAGRESTAVDNGASNKYLDELLAGFYKMAASNNQAGIIRTAVVGNIDDTPTWPDVFDGTDSTETVTDQPTYDSICRIISDIANDNTASQVWYWGPVAIAGMFGGVLPDQYVLFVSQSAHTSTNAWSSTESDHGIKRTPIYATSV